MRVYVGCLKVGCVYTCADPLQSTCTFVNFKKKNDSQAQVGSTSMEDQNPLKAQKLTKTQETINKLIQNTQKEYPQKTL
jgi:hypothetical protein